MHSLFFALLYFGFNWNRQVFSNPSMTVELWSSLPEAPVAQRVRCKSRSRFAAAAAAKSSRTRHRDAGEEEGLTKPLEAKPEKMKPAPKITQEVKPKPDAKTLAEQDAEKQIADQQAALEQAERAKQDEQAAAIGKVVDEYKAKIHDKIRRNVVNPPGVAKDARAEFLVTLIPGGVVLKAKLIKSSGNAAYDDAVERAILKSNPLPVPPDVQLFNRFRELDLVFKPDTNDETN